MTRIDAEIAALVITIIAAVIANICSVYKRCLNFVWWLFLGPRQVPATLQPK